MNIVAEVPTWLVFLYFVDDKEMNGPLTVAGWATALEEMKGALALPEHHLLNGRIVHVFAEATPYGGKR